jgi:hypothetical protein
LTAFAEFLGPAVVLSIKETQPVFQFLDSKLKSISDGLYRKSITTWNDYLECNGRRENY